MIQVTGVLVDPLNQPMVNTTIRVSAENSEKTVLSAAADEITDGDGNYNFNLVEGLFNIDILIDDEFNVGVIVLVDETTPVTIDLPTLLKNHSVAVEEADAITLLQEQLNALEIRVTNHGG